MNNENQMFISNDDLEKFLMLNKNLDKKRAQLRENLRQKFQIWKQSLPYKI